MSTGNIGTMGRSGSLRFDTSRFRRNISKHISRTKERVLHNLDKSEKTDDQFIRKSEAILLKKQISTTKLQTELKRHLKALKNVSASSRSLHETMLEAYEDNWAGRKDFADALETLDSSWLHYFNTLCTVLEQVGSHIDEFVTIKDKMEKRKRKLVDYNLAKRNMCVLNAAKKRDEGKLKKAKRDLDFMESAYYSLNHELRGDLPQFYDSHVHFCCENWSYLVESEKRMYEDLISTVHRFISSLNQLRIGYQKSEYKLRDIDLNFSDINRSSLSLTVDPTYSNSEDFEVYEQVGDHSCSRRGSIDLHSKSRTLGVRGVQRHASSANHFLKPDPVQSMRAYSMDNLVDSDGYGTLGPPDPPKPLALAAVAPTVMRRDSIEDPDGHVYAEIDKSKKQSKPDNSVSSGSFSVKRKSSDIQYPDDIVEQSPRLLSAIKLDDSNSLISRNPSRKLASDASRGTPSPDSSMSSRHHSISRSTNSNSPHTDKSRRSDNLPLRMALHPYVRQDDDELDLAVNDLVQVLPWENESLKEDGWLFGMKLPDSKKGLFPENHTIVFVT